MSTLKEEYQELAEDLKTQRDDINVRLHLLGMEAREEWNDLEKKYQQLRGKLKKASEAAEASSDDVKSAAKTLANEIKAGYKRIKSTL